MGAHPNFADVFAEYKGPIYNYLLRVTQDPAEAEDLIQETFVRVHWGLPDFRGESSLTTFFTCIAREALLLRLYEMLRKDAPQTCSSIPEATRVAPGAGSLRYVARVAPTLSV